MFTRAAFVPRDAGSPPLVYRSFLLHGVVSSGHLSKSLIACDVSPHSQVGGPVRNSTSPCSLKSYWCLICGCTESSLLPVPD